MESLYEDYGNKGLSMGTKQCEGSILWLGSLELCVFLGKRQYGGHCMGQHMEEGLYEGAFFEGQMHMEEGLYEGALWGRIV